MRVCHCHNVNDRQLAAAIDEGCHTMRELRFKLNIGNTCGRCLPQAKQLLNTQLMQIAEPTTRLKRVSGF